MKKHPRPTGFKDPLYMPPQDILEGLGRVAAVSAGITGAWPPIDQHEAVPNAAAMKSASLMAGRPGISIGTMFLAAGGVSRAAPPSALPVRSGPRFCNSRPTTFEPFPSLPDF